MKIHWLQNNKGLFPTVWGCFETPFGLSYMALEGDSIIYFAFGNKPKQFDPIRKDEKAVQRVFTKFLQAYLNDQEDDSIKLKIVGTPFQIMVWKALLKIQRSEISSYLDVSKKINNPKAVRAVGQAIGANPVSLWIPCHRVIRSNGDLGGYAGGLTVKKKLLNFEKEEAYGSKKT